MQTGTHTATFSKSGNGRHVYVLRVVTPTHIVHGHKTLQMYGFPTQIYGENSRWHISNHAYDSC